MPVPTVVTMSLTRQAPLILFVAYPGTGLLGLTSPQTAFWAAQHYIDVAGRDLLPYEGHTVSLQGGPVRTEEGVVVETLPMSMFDERGIDTVMVPGAAGIAGMLDELGPTVDWIQRASRRAATHWALCHLLEQRFPALTVDRGAIFVRDEHIWTSAGVTAGIDLTLALVEEDFGRAVAMDLARELAVFMKRQGGQSQ